MSKRAEEGSLAPGRQRRIVRVEANLLRLPLFALHTKGLSTLDGVESRGIHQRNGVTRQYSFRATRNLGTGYPGPLARAAHMGLLGLISRQPSPLSNPITFGWRDLCRMMEITASGRTVGQLKEAIRATRGLLISSQSALFAKGEGPDLWTNERDLSLYDEVVFINETLPNGTIAATNHVWLSEWYLTSINAKYTAPIDHELWLSLDKKSSVASRLYEFLLLNFHSGAPLLRFNYAKLAKSLPVKVERYLSDARRQLQGALQLLEEFAVVAEVSWVESKDGQPQLVFRPGPILTESDKSSEQPESEAKKTDPKPQTPTFAWGSDGEAVEVRELRGMSPTAESKTQGALASPEVSIVTSFHDLWSGGSPTKPASKELEHARLLLSSYGLERVSRALPDAVKILRAQWPDAKTFGAIQPYLVEVLARQEKAEAQAISGQAELEARLAHRSEALKARHEAERLETHWRPAWNALTDETREQIRRSILDLHPYADRMPKVVEQLCLAELAKRFD